MVRQVQLCYDTKKSASRMTFVPLFYEAAKHDRTSTPDKMSLRTLYYAVEQEIEADKENGITLELTALGVGAKTIGGKTYVAIGLN